ncbi:MAG TPA: SGNH/GDSL hydrolase family protein [Dehalococcoidia bacterium]|nr:SGNH/GDSL hydrolase family protein [Dehalococcoidia bacterium]
MVIATVVAAAAVAAVAVGGGTSRAAATRASGSAVYISIGDGIQWGCCVKAERSADALFARYLSDRLGRGVEWVSLAQGDRGTFVTTDTLLRTQAMAGSQMQRLREALATYRREGRPVVAITLSVGGNNLVNMGRGCPAPPCTAAYEQALSRMTRHLDAIYEAINAAKDASTPLLVLTYYNASDCGQAGVATSPTELGVRGWNAAIEAAVARNHAFVVDGYTAFRGQACELIDTSDKIDLNEAGHRLLAQQYERAYAALPPPFVTPFEAAGTNWWLVAGVPAVTAVALALLAMIVVRRRRGSAAGGG